MKLVKLIFPVVLIGMLFSCPIRGQEKEADSKVELYYKIQLLTASIETDSNDICSIDKAITLAKLGEVLNQIDKEKSRSFFLKSAYIIEDIMTSKKGDDGELKARNEKQQALRIIIAIILPFDKPLSEKLTVLLGEDTEEFKKRIQEEAVKVSKSNPQKSFSLGAQLIAANATLHETLPILYALGKSSQGIASRFFSMLVDQARNQNNLESLTALLYEGLPQLSNPAYSGWVPPKSDTEKLIRIICETAISNQAPRNDSECLNLCRAIDRLQNFKQEIQRQFPALFLRVDALVSTSDKVCEKIQPRPLEVSYKSADECLDAALDESNESARPHLLLKAAYMFFQEKKYERSIEVLSMISEKEKNKIEKDLFEEVYENYASVYACSLIEQKNNYKFISFLDDIPRNIRPFVKYKVAVYLIGRDKADGNCNSLIEKLAIESVMELNDTSSFKAFIVCLLFARMSEECFKERTLDILRSSVRKADKISYSRTLGNLLNDDRVGLDITPFPIPSKLVEMDDQVIFSLVNQVENPLLRIQFKIGILESLKILAEKHKSNSLRLNQ